MTDDRTLSILAFVRSKPGVPEFQIAMAFEQHALPIRAMLNRLIEHGLVRREIINRHRVYTTSPQGCDLLDAMFTSKGLNP